MRNTHFSNMLELTDILDELADLETITTIQEGRKAIEKYNQKYIGS